MNSLLTKSVLVAAFALSPVFAFAELGCTTDGNAVGFENCQPQTLNCYSFARLGPNTIATYNTVWNLNILSIVHDNAVVVSDSQIMGPLHINAEVQGHKIQCYAD